MEQRSVHPMMCISFISTFFCSGTENNGFSVRLYDVVTCVKRRGLLISSTTNVFSKNEDQDLILFISASSLYKMHTYFTCNTIIIY